MSSSVPPPIVCIELDECDSTVDLASPASVSSSTLPAIVPVNINKTAAAAINPSTPVATVITPALQSSRMNSIRPAMNTHLPSAGQTLPLGNLQNLHFPIVSESWYPNNATAAMSATPNQPLYSFYQVNDHNRQIIAASLRSFMANIEESANNINY